MRTLLLLIMIALAGAWFYPPYAEEAPNICSAFEQRMSRLVQAEASRVLPQGRTNDPRVNALLDTMKTAVAGANGAIAQAYVKDKFPQMPAELVHEARCRFRASAKAQFVVGAGSVAHQP